MAQKKSKSTSKPLDKRTETELLVDAFFAYGDARNHIRTVSDEGFGDQMEEAAVLLADARKQLVNALDHMLATVVSMPVALARATRRGR